MHDMGVPDERISVVGYGEEISTHDNDTQEGREKNPEGGLHCILTEAYISLC